MEGGRAPEQKESDPAHVVAQLVVVRVRQQGERVGGVHGEERDDAPDQEIEGRCPLAVIDRQADCGGEEQDVAERVGGRHRLLERRQAGEMNVRSDQEHPGEKRDADGDDQRVDHACAVALRVSPADEDEQARHERRIDGQVDGVPDGRELHLDAHELGVAVGVEVAGEEEKVADDEEHPGRPRFGAVQIDPDRDRDR